MGKGASRKFDKEMKAPRPAVAVATLSPEDAERAAAAIVPLWQFDEAPFAAGAQVAESDLASLAGVGAMPLALQLAPAPVLGAAIAPIVSDPTVVTPAPTDGGADGESGDPELMSRATVRMAPLLQPLPARPTEPSLPSVIVEETVALAAEASSSVIVAPDPAPPVVAAPAPEPVVVAAPPAPLREPIRRRHARRRSSPSRPSRARSEIAPRKRPRRFPDPATPSRGAEPRWSSVGSAARRSSCLPDISSTARCRHRNRPPRRPRSRRRSHRERRRCLSSQSRRHPLSTNPPRHPRS